MQSMNMPLTTVKQAKEQRGFTVVELLVVIVVIGILAAIIIVSYTGITGRANAVALQSDLTNASQQLKIYQTTNGIYPNAIDCSVTPAISTICLKSSGNDIYNSIKVNNNVSPQTFCLSANNGGSKYYTTDSASPTTGTCVSSCLDILNSGSSTGDGLYWINPAGTSLHVYCDMTTDSGGWTLVLQNNSTVTTPSPSWSDSINTNNISGSLSSNLTTFDVLLGLGYWNNIGTQLRAQVGTSPTTLLHKATYTFSLNTSNYYALNLSNQNILVGANAPGLYYAHNNSPFTTYDADHDSNSGNCATYYNNHPWWYTSCWDGNFFSGGSSYQEAAYWTGSTADYYAYGSIWIR
jgi:general secretion pathway protein G